MGLIEMGRMHGQWVVQAGSQVQEWVLHSACLGEVPLKKFGLELELELELELKLKLELIGEVGAVPINNEKSGAAIGNALGLRVKDSLHPLLPNDLG